MNTVDWLVVSTYLGILGLLSTYGLHRLFIAWLYWRHRHVRAPSLEAHRLPVVTVQLPVFNERNVVERLIDAACALDWPGDRLEIQVLDDSTDETQAVAERAVARQRRRGIDIHHIQRTDRTGFKAGALAAGTEVARGELLAVFDADFVPPPSFLRDVVPRFDGFGPGPHRIGMVQARWTHLNEDDNLLTRLSAVLLDGHFVLEHTARNRSGRFFNFNGTAGIWRRSAIAEAGGWQHDTLTEDLDLSYRAQLAGWQFVFLPEVTAPAELPADMRAFKVQQHRWAKGTLQAARKLLPRILRSDQPLRVKAEAFVHLTNNLAYPLVLLLALLMPPTVFIRGRGSVAETLLLDLPAFVLATFSVALFYALAEREAHGSLRGRWARIPMVMGLGIGMAVTQSRAVFEGLFGRDVTFVRTPKRGTGKPTRRYAATTDWTPWVETGLGLYFAVSIVLALLEGYWASLPFMSLFGGGFLFVGARSLVEGTRPTDAPPAVARTTAPLARRSA